MTGDGAARSKTQEGEEGDGGGIPNSILSTLFNMDQEVLIAQFIVDDRMSPEVVVETIWNLCRGVSTGINASALCTRLWQTIYTRIVESPYLSLLESYPFSNGFDIRKETQKILIIWYRIMLHVNSFCESLRALWALMLPLIDEENERVANDKDYASDEMLQIDTIDTIDANFFIDFNVHQFFQEQRFMMNDAYNAAELSVAINMTEVYVTREQASALFSQACKQACECLGKILGIVGDLKIVYDDVTYLADEEACYHGTGFQYTAAYKTNAYCVLDKQTLVRVLRKFVELQNDEEKQDCSWKLEDCEATEHGKQIDCRVHITKTNAINEPDYVLDR